MAKTKHRFLSLLLAAVLVLCMVPTMAFADDAVADGTYKLDGLTSSLSMFKFNTEESKVVVNGSSVTMTIVSTADRYDHFDLGKYSEVITSDALITSHPGIEGKANDKGGYTFVISLDQTTLNSFKAGGKLYYILKYRPDYTGKDGKLSDNAGKWYKPTNDAYLTITGLTPVTSSDEPSTEPSGEDPAATGLSLAVTNNYKMFKVESATLTQADGKNTLVMVIGSTSYDRILVGTGASAAETAGTEGVVAGEKTTFTIDVPTLDSDVQISLRSSSSKAWNDRFVNVSKTNAALVTDNSEADVTAIKTAITKAESLDRTKYDASKLAELDKAVEAGQKQVDKPSNSVKQADADKLAADINAVLAIFIDSDALTVTNKLNMFKVVSATLETASDGSKSVVFALSGTSYHYLVKGTYEEASAIGNDKTKWIAGATNTDGKWEFKVPVADGETVIPLVAVSQTYLDKADAGENPVTRAFYPRQITLDAEAKTLLVEDYKASRELTVTNNVKMFKVASAALTTVGGPNSNGYAKTLDLVMGSDSFDKAFVGRASAATAEGAKTVAITDRNVSLTLMWMEKAGDLDSITDLTKEPVVIAFHSVKNDSYYDRQFTVSEKDGTLVIDEAPAEAPAAEEGPITKAVTESGAEVAYGYKDIAEANTLTTTKAAEVNKEAEKAEDLEILWQKDVQIPAGTTFPVTLTFAVDEKYAEKDIYVYHFNGTDWEVAGKGKGTSVSAKFESLSPVALVAMNPAPAAPQTADASVTLWAMLFTAAAAVAVSTVSFRGKRREE